MSSRRRSARPSGRCISTRSWDCSTRAHGRRAGFGSTVPKRSIASTLAEIQGFVRDFQSAGSAPEATARVRALFQEKQQQIREQITQLSVIENDINEALAYLDSCQTCSSDYAPTECGACDHQGHQKGEAPPLFAGLSSKRHEEKEFDVPVNVLNRDALSPREGNN